MLKNLDAEALMQDAREMQGEAVRMMDAGDWRDAADKGWLAARNATAALVWEVTGVHNQTSTQINAGLRRLARERRGEYEELSRLYSKFGQYLHSQAFYNGFYHEDLPDIVRGDVAEYIRRAEGLAG